MSTTHTPHLAHHFDTPEQQSATGKLGMWVFLATEILMFGGLFCAYSVYRHNHPDVFAYADQYLDRNLGALNTIILISSSLTMAWGVRMAQLNRQRGLIVCLILTILGGAGFMAIKSIEYDQKWKHHLWIGTENVFSRGYKGSAKPGEHDPAASRRSEDLPAPLMPMALDPNAGTPDQPKISAPAVGPQGLAPSVAAPAEHRPTYAALSELDRARVATFFSIYFMMTGLHGIHVLVGMSLIFWILIRAAAPRQRAWIVPGGPLLLGVYLLYVGGIVRSRWVLLLGAAICALGLGWMALRLKTRRSEGHGEFSSQYFAPVDLVGLYWHLVDLIWIFLFPLLYLIH